VNTLLWLHLLALLHVTGIPQGSPRTPDVSVTGSRQENQNAQAVFHIPYRLDETQHVEVRAKINGHGPFNFIMDTGAPVVFVSREVAARCEIKPDTNGWGTCARMEIEGGAVVDQIQARIEEPFQLQGMNALGLAAEHIDGVLGYNLLARFSIELDVTQSKMLWRPSGLRPAIPENIEKLTAEEQMQTKTATKSQEGLERLARMATALLARQATLQTVRRGFFGIELDDSEPRIKAVLPGSPATQAGLAVGDVILSLVKPGNEAVATHRSMDVLRGAANIAPGEIVIFVVQRGTGRIKRTVRAGKAGF